MITADTLDMAAVDRAKQMLTLPARQTLADYTFDGVVSALWRGGLDTCTISRVLGAKDYPESRVANRLAQLRDARAL